METIREINLAEVKLSDFKQHLADCVVLTHDNKILLQQRTLNWGSAAGCLTTFGGHVEDGETIMEGLKRELNEEIGVNIKEEEVVFIGAVAEEMTNYSELVHVHFWHDKNNTVTGCYEAEAVRYDTILGALSHPKIMDYVVWALKQCENRGLIK